jgi:hypothetical protein
LEDSLLVSPEKKSKTLHESISEAETSLPCQGIGKRRQKEEDGSKKREEARQR